MMLVAVLIILGILINIIARRVKEKRREFIERLKTEERTKLKKRTAEDFHDQMGNKLTRISILAEMVKKKAPDEKAMSELLDQIRQNSFELYTGTKDVIWSLSSEPTSLAETLSRIKGFAIDLFQNTQIQFESDELNERFNTSILPSDFYHDLVMIFKEALNNILKYSECTKVRLKIQYPVYDEIELRLEDNGKGFESALVSRGSGIANMQLRAKRIHAGFDIQSFKDKGTTISIKFREP